MIETPPPPPPGFEWDDEMNARCLAHYGFDFPEVADMFACHRYEVLRLGPYLSGEEVRWIAVGAMPWGSVFSVVYTERPPRLRLIWVRPARRSERALFNQHNEIGP